MGVAHLIGLADTELAVLAGQRPMLADQRLVLFGCDESDPETFHKAVLDARPHLSRFADHRVRADPAGCAGTALNVLLQASDGITVRFDVDAVDSGDLPLANFPHYGTGVTLQQAGQALSVAMTAQNTRPSFSPKSTQVTTRAVTRSIAM